MIEKQIGDYKVLEYIGSGGMAKVYLAVHKEIPNLKVVLKVLSNPQHAERFKQEADKLALLDRNPNICKIRHFFNHGDDFVIAMEYIEGPSLEKIIKQREKINISDSLKIILDILSALEPAHEEGIYHRDIKPSNIMFSKSGQVKIIDFGIAKGKSDPKLTVVGTAAGTPEYMAPEQFGAGEEIDYARCDIYAVGTMLYKMVTGEMPYKGENEFLLRDAKMFGSAPAPSRINPAVGKELDEIIMKSIESDPAKRFGSVAEMREQLEKVYAKHKNIIPEREKAGTTAEMRIRPERRSSAAKILIPAAAIVIVAAVLYMTDRLPFIERGGESPASDTSSTAALPVETEQRDSGGAGAAGASREERGLPAEEGAGDDAGSTTGSKEDAGAAASVKGKEERTEDRATAPATLKKTAKPAQGKLAVGSRPARGAVFIDGAEQLQKTPYTFDLDPGEYSIRIVISVDGVERVYSETVTVESGRTVNIFWNAET